jgi:hypothetical protein
MYTSWTEWIHTGATTALVETRLFVFSQTSSLLQIFFKKSILVKYFVSKRKQHVDTIKLNVRVCSTQGIIENSKSCLRKVQNCFFAHCCHTGVGLMSSLPAGLQAFSSCHWIVQNGNFCSRVSSWIESSFGELSPAAPLPPIGPPPGGHIDCHLSAIVDTIGGRIGLLSRILSSSFIVLVLSLGTSCNTHLMSIITTTTITYTKGVMAYLFHYLQFPS